MYDPIGHSIFLREDRRDTHRSGTGVLSQQKNSLSEASGSPDVKSTSVMTAAKSVLKVDTVCLETHSSSLLQLGEPEVLEKKGQVFTSIVELLLRESFLGRS